MNRTDKRRQKKLAIKQPKPVQQAALPPIQPQQTLTIQQAIDLARQHHTAGDLLKAESIYQQILQADPNQHVALHLLGVIAHQVGKNDIAVDLIKKAITIKPDYAKAHNNLGNALQALGKLDEAVDSYKKAIAIKPDYAEAHRHLASVRKHSEYDEDIRAMEKVYAKSGINDEQKMHLAFGLGKAFEGLQQYEKAFDYLVEGNTIKRKTYIYSINEESVYFNKIKETFNASLFAKHQETGCNDETPIFILGMPRSGTTLVEQILASHPQVHGAGELETLGKIALSYFDKGKCIEFPKSIRV